MRTRGWFEKLIKQGEMASTEDLTKSLETLPEAHELPDVFTNLFDENWFTRKRAQSDPKIYDTIRGEVLDGVKMNIKEIIPFLDAKDQEDILKEPRAFSQLKMLKPAFEKSFQALKDAKPPSDDEKLKELKNQVTEFTKKLSDQKNEYEGKIKEKDQFFEKEKKNLLLDFSLNNKIGEFTFADEFKELRPNLIKLILDKVKGENILILNDKGQIEVHEETQTPGVTKPKYNGNDQVTLEKLLEEPIKPYLKKNNGGQSAGADPKNGQNGSQGRQNQPPPAKDISQMSLAEYNRHMASNGV